MFLAYILLPNRISSDSKTLIYNIFSNFILIEVTPANKTNIFERTWSTFNHENFILDYFYVNWPNVFKIDLHNVDLSINNFYEAIYAVLDKHTPYQKVKKYNLKLKAEPWITAGIKILKKSKINFLKITSIRKISL